MILYIVQNIGNDPGFSLDGVAETLTLGGQVIPIPVSAIRDRYGAGDLVVYANLTASGLTIGVFTPKASVADELSQYTSGQPLMVASLPAGSSHWSDAGVRAIVIRYVTDRTPVNVFKVYTYGEEMTEHPAQFLVDNGSCVRWAVHRRDEFYVNDQLLPPPVEVQATVAVKGQIASEGVANEAHAG